MPKKKFSYGDKEFAMVGITKDGNAFIGGPTYANEIFARRNCIMFSFVLVDDLDILIDSIEHGNITGDDLAQWLYCLPTTVHMN